MTADQPAHSGSDSLLTPSMKHAAMNVGRAFALLVTLYLLIVLRGHSNVVVNLAVTGLATLSVWLLFGRGNSGARMLVFYLMGFGLFAQLRTFADNTGIPHHFAYVLSAETDVFGVLPTHWLQQHLYNPDRISPLDVYCVLVYFSYFVALHLTAFAIWRWRREWFGTFAGAAMLVLFIGLAVSIAVPTAPPWLAGQTGHTVAVSRILKQLMAYVSGNAYQSGDAVAGVNDVAAMPSLHTAVTVLLALTAWRFDRRLGLLGALYALSMSFTLVYFGEHYVMDVLAGIALAIGCWAVALRLWPLRAVVGTSAERRAPAGVLIPTGAAAASLDDTATAA